MGSRRRRNILLNTLSPMQHTYIEDAFRLIDEDKSELINLNEIKRIVNSVGSTDGVGEDLPSSTEQQLAPSNNTNSTNYAPWQKSVGESANTKKITKEDFFGLMAESEMYQLFIDTFKTLDPHDSGFVRTKDLDAILCGVRDLISDDRKSIIDVVDEDMMVDYEQFSRMLLGTKL